MYRNKITLVLLCFLFIITGCSFFSAAGPKEKIQVYTTLDKSFVEALCVKFNEGLPSDKQIAFEVTDAEDQLAQSDCIISGEKDLKQKAAADMLQPMQAEYADLLPLELKDEKDRWITLFYDPAVLLINQEYSRKVGQQQILHWLDVPKQTGAQIVMENLSDNDSTVGFLTAMSSRMGQHEFLSWLKELRPMIRQYAKFPITPVRMAATGDADIAVTRRSHVFKYLQNDFPAYVLIPEEGTPVNLYGLGIVRNSKKQKGIVSFANWILQSPDARTALMTTRCGFLPVLPQGDKGQTVNMDRLWLNTFYKEEAAVEKLTETWLKEIRLAGEDVK